MRNIFSIQTKMLCLVLVCSSFCGTTIQAQQSIDPNPVALPLQARPIEPKWGHAKHPGTFNWMRETPKHKGRVIRKLRQGTKFKVVGISGVYYAIILEDGLQGWLNRDCIVFD